MACFGNGQHAFAGYRCMEIMDFLLILSYHMYFSPTAENWEGQTFVKEINSGPIGNM